MTAAHSFRSWRASSGVGGIRAGAGLFSGKRAVRVAESSEGSDLLLAAEERMRVWNWEERSLFGGLSQ